MSSCISRREHFWVTDSKTSKIYESFDSDDAEYEHVACVLGKVAAACKTDSDCDSAPGSPDGSCDACAVKGGQTTE